MLYAVTSSIIWWTRRPLIAANMPRIIGGASLSGFPGFLLEVRPGLSGCRSSSDHGAVDVREHLLAHVLPVDRCDHGPVRDGNDERRSVHEDERLAPALCSRPRDSVLEPGKLVRADVDAAALDPVERVPAELERSRLDELPREDVAERTRRRGWRRRAGSSRCGSGLKPPERVDSHTRSGAGEAGTSLLGGSVEATPLTLRIESGLTCLPSTTTVIFAPSISTRSATPVTSDLSASS